MSLIKEVIRANERQKLCMVEKLKKMLGLFSNKKVAVLGLAFKAETDDVRESPAITIIWKLLEEGVKVKALQNVDACIICTEWNEYRNLDLEKIKELMRESVILDLRNVLDIDEVKRLRFIYQGMGRK